MSNLKTRQCQSVLLACAVCCIAVQFLMAAETKSANAIGKEAKVSELISVLKKSPGDNPERLKEILAAKRDLAAKGVEAVAPVIDLLKCSRHGGLDSGGIKDLKSYDITLPGTAIDILAMMPADVRSAKVIPSLKALRDSDKVSTDIRLYAHHALALLDPATRNSHVLEEQYVSPARPSGSLDDFNKVADPKFTNGDQYYKLRGVKPDKAYVPVIIQAIKNSETCRIELLAGMLKDLGDQAGIDALVNLLETEKADWFPRWAATKSLEIIGRKATAALPSLEKAFADKNEDIDVRVGAARAIARIKGTDVSDLYGKIDNLEERLVAETRKKAMAWRKEICVRDGARFKDVYATAKESKSWDDKQIMPYCVMALASEQHVGLANQYLTERARRLLDNKDGLTFWESGQLSRALLMFYSKSHLCPGRLTPETEATLKGLFFALSDHATVRPWNDRRYVLTTEDINEALNGLKSENTNGRNSNGYLRPDMCQYLGLAVLAQDPEYRNRKLKAGDSVHERFEGFNRYWPVFWKYFATKGLSEELGSSGYEATTYASYFNAVDMVPDPALRKLAKMYLDMACIEREQITLSGLRGGSIARPKHGVLGSRLDLCVCPMLYGQRGMWGFMVAPEIVTSSYEAPEVAILLNKLGPAAACYEIINRQPSPFPVRNYAYRTPDYTMGTAFYDPNIVYDPPSIYSHGSAVIFRDLNVVSMPGYTGSNWGVQDRDVKIFQRLSGSYYVGWPRLYFTPRLEEVEREGWVFTRSDDGFMAIKVVTGGYVWSQDKSRMYVNDRFSPVIIQTGSASQYGTYAAFQKAIMEAPLKLTVVPDDSWYDGKRLVEVDYTGPQSKRIEFYTDPYNNELGRMRSDGSTNIARPLPKIDGNELSFDLEYNYQSPYMQCKTGSAQVKISFGDRTWVYDFEKNTITEVAK